MILQKYLNLPINIHKPLDTNNLSLFEVELLINDKLVLSQSEALQSIKNDWDFMKNKIQ